MKISLARTIEDEELFIDEKKFSEMKLVERRKFILKLLNVITEELLFDDNIKLTDVLEVLPNVTRFKAETEDGKTVYKSNWEI